MQKELSKKLVTEKDKLPLSNSAIKKWTPTHIGGYKFVIKFLIIFL